MALDISVEELRRFLRVAGGEGEADLYIEGGSLVNVFTGEIYPANVAVYRGRIAYVGGSRRMVGAGTQIIDASGCYLCPGFIEAHAHPWMACNPVRVIEAALFRGTTTFVCDNLYFYANLGADGFLKVKRALDSLPVGMYWLARIMQQTPVPDEEEVFSISNLARVFAEPGLLRVGEITRWPLLAEGNESALQKISLAKEYGKGIEGHTSGCSYDRLNVIAVAGIDSCHEAITAEEVVQRLRLGFWTILRHSSLRPDLPELLRAVTEHKVHTGRLMFTTDGSCPAFLLREGFTEGMLRTAVRAGLSPVTAIQMATVNPAVYLGLDQETGSIAPGRRADILLLPDLENFRPRLVIAGGKVAAADGELCVPMPEPDWFSLGLRTRLPPLELISDYSTYGLPASEPAVFPVIEAVSAAITRLNEMPVQVRDGFLDCGEDLLYCTLIDRYGRWISNGFIKGLGRFDALATTFNAPCGLMVLGSDRRAMAGAAAAVSEIGGGVVLVEEGREVFRMPLRYGGLMDGYSFEEAASRVEELEEKVRQCGYPYNDILYTMLFLDCDFLPGPRITTSGIYDVKSRKVLFPSRESGVSREL